MACPRVGALDLPNSLSSTIKLSSKEKPFSLAFPTASLELKGSVVAQINGSHPHKPSKINGYASKPINGFGPVNGSTSPHLNGFAGINGDVGPRVAFQGSFGAYSEFAAKTVYPDCNTLPRHSFADAIAAVERNQADLAVLPVESTMEGIELRNYDLLLQHDLLIVQEINLFVNYCLLAMPGVRQTQLKRVISHPMALAHCHLALAQLGLDQEPVEDTAGAVEMLRANHLLDTAAIASPRTASIYGLNVLAQGLQDESWNMTRFLLLAKSPAEWVFKNAKTSMVIAHRGGSMMVVLKVLSAFSSRKINLTKLEVINSSGEGQVPVMILDVRGRGSLRAFPYVLYVDCEGSIEDPVIQEAIKEIERCSVFVRILGCYTADTTVYDLQ